MENYHVMKSGTSWVLKREGEERMMVSFGSDREGAIRISSGYLRTKPANLKIHGPDGTVLKERSFP